MKNKATLNHAFRLVWSDAQQAFVAVSEHIRGKSKSKTSGVAAAVVISALSFFGASTTYAGPEGGVITAGSGSISQAGDVTTINQASNTLKANWDSFNVKANETVNFIQPGQSSLAVNYILDANGSKIMGGLNANGQVWLINPNGVFFGQSATINVGSILASTLNPLGDITTDGTQTFGGNGTGSIINQGNINANNGYVAFIGNTVSNQGNIVANNGTVALGAGSQVSLQFANNNLLSLTVDQSTLDNLAENKQLIQANGGAVLISAGAKDSLLASVVNNEGTIEAKTVEHKDGKIILMGGMAAGTTNVAGTLDASAAEGDGGFIETSAAHVKVADDANVTTHAENGETGTWLIDPVDFTVAATGGDMTGAAVNTALANNNLQIESTQGANGTAGDINIDDSITWSSNNDLTLTAQNNINLNQDITANGATAKLNLEYGQASLAAGNTADYQLNHGAQVNLQAGDNFSTTQGSDGLTKEYKVITELGTETSSAGETLQGINGNLAGNYALGADIDASATSAWNAGDGFNPIGDGTTQYTGTFDGLGHTVTNLTVDRPSENFVGLFGYTNGASIKNIGLIAGAVRGNISVGGLVGVNGFNSHISNAYSTGSVAGLYEVGGLVGLNNGASISNAYVIGDVSGDSIVGGLVGVNNGSSISNAYSTGVVTGNNSKVGGLVGFNESSHISNAYATGDVHGNDEAGGLVGHDNNSTVSNTYSTGDVYGRSFVGGLVGNNYNSDIINAYATGDVNGSFSVGGLVGNSESSDISNTYATGAVVGNDNVGGLVGYNGSSDISNSYWGVASTGQANGVGQNAGASAITNLAGKTTAEMQQLATFASGGWDISAVGGDNTVWRIYEGNTAPLLRSFMTAFDLGTTTTNYNGTAQSATVYTDPLILGSAATGTDANTYQTSYYSTQQGYDFVNGDLIIDQLMIDLTAKVAAENKVYDGNRDATVSVFSHDIINNDAVTFSYNTALFDSANAGQNKTVTVDGIATGGADAGNYVLQNTSATTTANIDQKAITLKGNREYDGTTTIAAADIEVDGVVAGETLNVIGAGTVHHKDVGNDKLVTASYTLADGAGLASNYVVSGGPVLADITPKVLTANGYLWAADKTYDGTTDASVFTFGTRLDGLVGNEKFWYVRATNGQFNDKNAGVNKTVTANYVLGWGFHGAKASNYTVAPRTTTATINKAKLTYVADHLRLSVSDVQNGNYTLGGSVQGFVAGETIDTATTGSLSWDSNVQARRGTYSINGSGLSADNYTFRQSYSNRSAFKVKSSWFYRPFSHHSYGSSLWWFLR